jgi:hypothetical protein
MNLSFQGTKVRCPYRFRPVRDKSSRDNFHIQYNLGERYTDLTSTFFTNQKIFRLTQHCVQRSCLYASSIAAYTQRLSFSVQQSLSYSTT